MEYSMTETQTDPSPWDGLIERMQGRMMVAGQCSVEGPEDTASLMAQAEAEFLRECLNAIATARAAVERQHAEALAEKAAQIADLERGIRSLHETADGRAAALRDEVQARAKAEAENATLRAQVETLTAERDELWGANHLNANALRLKSTSLAAVEGALRGLLELGRKDTSNPKYDGYYEAAQAALTSPAPAAQTPETTSETVKPEVPNLMAALKKSLEQLTPTGEKDPR